jgi:hypothetical protein
MEHIQSLIDVASDPIGSGFEETSFPQSLSSQVLKFLSKKDGFYAFEGALLARPLHDTPSVLGLVTWNSFDLWKSHYSDTGTDIQSYTFFAENIFGEQFFLADDWVGQFDPETGESHKIADSVDAWAGEVLADCDYLTGHGLARQWQERHGRLPEGSRLIPKVPFVLQGEFIVSNLVAKLELEAITIRAQLASQLAGLKDGETIAFEITD